MTHTSFPQIAQFCDGQVFFGTETHPAPEHPEVWSPGVLVGVVEGHGVYAVSGGGAGRVVYFYCVEPGALRQGFSVDHAPLGKKLRCIKMYSISFQPEFPGGNREYLKATPEERLEKTRKAAERECATALQRAAEFLQS